MATNFSESASLYNFVVKNGNGVKGMVDLGLSEVPKQYVQPLEERIDKNKYGSSTNSPIDLSKLYGTDHDQVAQQIVKAAKTLGFFQVVNHGVPIELLESLKESAHRFFSQPPEKKAIYRKGSSPTPLVNYGSSFAPETEKVFEWRDFVSMEYRNDAEALEFWPEECREDALQYLRLSIQIVKKLLKVLIENLGVKLDNEKIDALIETKFVNMNIYPACPNPDLTIGMGRHSDIGTLTVLLQDEIGGLFVKIEENINENRKEDWIEIPSIPGALVINVGDTLQILSNGKYKSAEHRTRTASTKARVSIPVFTTPGPTERIRPLPEVVEKDGLALYREVLFEDYDKNFINNRHVGKKTLDFANIN